MDAIPDAARTLPGRQPTAARLLLGQFTGHCADVSPDATPDAAWTATVIAKSFAHPRANLDAHFGAHVHANCRDTSR